MNKTVVLMIGMVAFFGVSFAQMSANCSFDLAGKTEVATLSEFKTDYQFGGRAMRSSFTRGSGFVIRPELYRGVFANFGYQINPYIQTYLGVGYSDGLDGALGLRAYTGDANWVAMFDFRFSVTNFVLPGVALVAGASYKDLDFGAGLKYYTDGYYYLYVPVLTVGWNIRCYEHR